MGTPPAGVPGTGENLNSRLQCAATRRQAFLPVPKCHRESQWSQSSAIKNTDLPELQFGSIEGLVFRVSRISMWCFYKDKRQGNDQFWLDQEVLQGSGRTNEDVARWMESQFKWLIRAYTKGEVEAAGQCN